jgi:hypothetical protein
MCRLGNSFQLPQKARAKNNRKSTKRLGITLLDDYKAETDCQSVIKGVQWVMALKQALDRYYGRAERNFTLRTAR